MSPLAWPTAYASVAALPESFAFGTLPVTQRSELRASALARARGGGRTYLPVSSMTALVRPPRVMFAT
jgi:hypothetical protein